MSFVLQLLFIGVLIWIDNNTLGILILICMLGVLIDMFTNGSCNLEQQERCLTKMPGSDVDWICSAGSPEKCLRIVA